MAQDGVLVPDNVENLLRKSVARLEAEPADPVTAERDRLDALLTDLDARIRRTAQQVVNGIIDEDDARAINAPLLDQREQARLSRAALPSAAPLPSAAQLPYGPP